jgi:hypothetical protein
MDRNQRIRNAAQELEFAARRLHRAVQYGDDMRSSSDLCLEDTRKLIANALAHLDAAEAGPVPGSDEFYVQIARDTHGSAVRDNSRAELVAIGKAIEEGEDE